MTANEHPHAAASAEPLTGYERELLRRVREGENVCAGLTGPVVDGIYAALDQLWKRGLITLTTPDDDRASGGRAFDHDRITWSLTDEGRAKLEEPSCVRAYAHDCQCPRCSARAPANTRGWSP